MKCSGRRVERWRPVVGWEDLYSVSDCGRVRRDAGGRGAVAGRVLTIKRNRNGYGYVDLSRGDRKTRRLVHQLVAEAFLPPRPSLGHHPNHLDTDKLNNHPKNLEWATLAENTAHARANGLIAPLRGERNGRAKLTKEQVAEIRSLRGRVGTREIAKRFGVARSMVQRIHQGRAWKSSEWPDDLRVREFPAEATA